MATSQFTTTKASTGSEIFVRLVALVGGVGFLGPGLFAMLAPHRFFTSLATFEPYNRHFLQDLGAFQIGLGVMLLLAVWWRGADALSVTLTAAAIGATAHVVSHLVGRHLGGRPATDIPMFAVTAGLFAAAALVHRRRDDQREA